MYLSSTSSTLKTVLYGFRIRGEEAHALPKSDNFLHDEDWPPIPSIPLSKIRGEEIRDLEFDQNRQSITSVKEYVDYGLNLIRENRFEAAKSHFVDGDFANKLGVSLALSDSVITSHYKSEYELLNELERRTSNCMRTKDGIRIYCVWLDESVLDEYDRSLANNFNKEMSLLCAEEWIHELQAMNGEKPISSLAKILTRLGERQQSLLIDEIDVAAYLIDHKINLDKTRFIKRDNRELVKSLRHFQRVI
jgi:hypothetical protein